MSDASAFIAMLALLGLLAVGLGLLGLAVLQLGVDSRRSTDEDRVGRPTTWI